MTVDPWCTDEQVRTCPRLVDVSLDHQDVAGAITTASGLLTAWAGRRYGLEAVAKTFTPAMVGAALYGEAPGAYGVSCEGALTPGGRIEEVLAIAAGGVMIPVTNYPVRDHERLVPVVGASWWPVVGSYNADIVVTYKRGRPVPEEGVQAAVELAAELLADAIPSMKCRLSPSVVRVVRQGVVVERPSQGTGLAGVDAFLTAANPKRIGRAATVASPDTVHGYT